MAGKIKRRDFLAMANAGGLGSALTTSDLFAAYAYLGPVSVKNPLSDYPDRDWERIYRDIFRHDKTLIFMCCPNDTHNCLLNAFVKNDIVVRVEPIVYVSAELRIQDPPRTRGISPLGPVIHAPPQSGHVQGLGLLRFHRVRDGTPIP